jgi:hypothetical protein
MQVHHIGCPNALTDLLPRLPMQGSEMSKIRK